MIKTPNITVESFNKHSSTYKSYPERRSIGLVDDIPHMDYEINSGAVFMGYLERYWNSFHKEETTKATAKNRIYSYYWGNKQDDGSCVFDRDTRIAMASKVEGGGVEFPNITLSSIDNALFDLTNSGFFQREESNGLRSSTYYLNKFLQDKSRLNISVEHTPDGK